MKLKHLAVAAGAAVAAAAVVPAASADQPQRFTQYVDQTFFVPGTSAACGFPVFVTQNGTANVLLWQRDGTTAVREMDWSADFTLTFTAPTQGTSFSYKGGGTFTTTYPDGVYLGAPAIAVFTGFNRQIGGDPAEAGRTVTSAVVVFVDPSGIPGIDTLDVVSQTGHFLDAATARRCAALSR